MSSPPLECRHVIQLVQSKRLAKKKKNGISKPNKLWFNLMVFWLCAHRRTQLEVEPPSSRCTRTKSSLQGSHTRVPWGRV